MFFEGILGGLWTSRKTIRCTHCGLENHARFEGYFVFLGQQLAFFRRRVDSLSDLFKTYFVFDRPHSLNSVTMKTFFVLFFLK